MDAKLSLDAENKALREALMDAREFAKAVAINETGFLQKRAEEWLMKWSMEVLLKYPQEQQ